MSNEAVIKIEGVTKRYKDLIAVDDVSFQVQGGEIFGLLGPNGAGKSTLIESIIGLRSMDSGNVKIFGKELLPNIQFLRKSLGIQLQTNALFPYLKVSELLQLFSKINRTEKDHKDIILQCDAMHIMGKKIRELSGGQAQLVSVICALLTNAKLFFFDEPTNAMDPYTRRKIWELLRELKSNGSTVFFTTHDMNEAYQLCDRVGIMNNGKLIDVDSPNRLITKYSTNKVMIVDNDARWQQIEVESIGAVEKTDVHYDKLLLYTNRIVDLVLELKERCNSEGLQFEDFTIKETTLEDVFLILTGRRYENDDIN